MPFKSKAQRRKFAELLVKGEISEQTFEEWNRETGSAQLPERVHSNPKRRKKLAKSHGKRGRVKKTTSKSKTRSRSKPKSRRSSMRRPNSEG